MKAFGEKVRQLREERGISREAFCGDETELSIRQLYRVETGQSIPTLNKVTYIAQILGVSIGELTDGKTFELPARYKELKYLLLRIPTYGDQERLQKKSHYFDEIAEQYYEVIPEEERLMMDCLQSKIDVHFSDDVNFGEGILHEYFDQVLKKQVFSLNDLIVIDLYLACLASAPVLEGIYSLDLYKTLMERLLDQDIADPETALILNNVLLNNVDLAFRFQKDTFVEAIMSKSSDIMTAIHDFQKRPILSLVEWKYQLHFKNDLATAQESYTKAILFASLIGDTHLEEQLVTEWQKDTQNYP